MVDDAMRIGPRTDMIGILLRPWLEFVILEAKMPSDKVDSSVAIDDRVKLMKGMHNMLNRNFQKLKRISYADTKSVYTVGIQVVGA
jgi:hypothetical protein